MLLFVPKKVVVLLLLLLLAARHKYFFLSIWIYSRVVHHGAEGHGRGRKILHLLKSKSLLLSYIRQLLHILVDAGGVAGNEVGNELQAQIFFSIVQVE